MVACNKKTIDECLSIEISEVLMREVMEDLRLERMIEFPDIWITFGIFHHFMEIISDTPRLSSHDLSEMRGTTYRIDRAREKVSETISKLSEIFFMDCKCCIFLRCESYRLPIADTIFIKSELDTIREDEFRISEISCKLLRFFYLFESDMHIFRFPVCDRKCIFSFSFQKYKIRLSVFTSFWLIYDVEICELCEEVSELRTVCMLSRMTRGERCLDF
jgi:hypothetical protein